MADKQVDLTGQPITVDEENPDVGLLKSGLQKAVRRGMTEKAMTFAVQLLEKADWFVTWRRLRIIAVEDCGIPETINAVEVLYRQFLDLKGKNSKEIDWNAKRCVVAAALIMAESKKDRRADEFLELWDAMQKKKDVKPLHNLMELWTSVPDVAFDCHTIQGRRMGRGAEYWYQVSSKCENMTEEYARWREWWQGLMLALCKKTENQNRHIPTNQEKDEKSENKMRTTTTPEESE